MSNNTDNDDEGQSLINFPDLSIPPETVTYIIIGVSVFLGLCLICIILTSYALCCRRQIAIYVDKKPVIDYASVPDRTNKEEDDDV